LVNARYAKNVPGRKTDVSDAAWLRQLHSYGLLRGDWWNTQPASAPTVRPERFKKKQISPIYGYPVLSFLEMPLAFPARSHMKVDMKARCYYGHRRAADIMTDINSQHPFLNCSPPARGVCQHSCLACEAVSWTGNDTMIFGATIRH
jgi:hypothetical protein